MQALTGSPGPARVNAILRISSSVAGPTARLMILKRAEVHMD